jgi:hypothetical protein
VKNQKVYGKSDQGEYVSFHALSYNAPPLIQKSHFQRHAKEKATIIDGSILLIVDDYVGLAAHYFHFMEHLIGIWNFLTYDHPEDIKLILFAFELPMDNEAERWKGSANETNYLLLTSLFPNAKFGLLKNLRANRNLKAKTIYVSSRLRSHGIPACDYFNMNGSGQFSFHPERLQQMRDRLFNKLKIKMEPPKDCLRVTYCKRTTGRALEPLTENLFTHTLSQMPHCKLQVVDFAAISFKEQLQTIANTDFFIGVHGNGLTHLLFLPNHASVLEYYEGGESAFFRYFAQLRGLHYYGNSHDRWVTESYPSLENLNPFQESVTAIDLSTTMALISSASGFLSDR